jgi:hypothetical protein
MNRISERLVESRVSRFPIWLMPYLVLPVVFPNSFRTVSVPLFVCMGALCLLFRSTSIRRHAAAVYGLTCIVSCTYLLVGVMRGASEAADWVFFVYILSPLLWLAISSVLLKSVRPDYLAKWLTWLGVAGSLTVFLFFYLFDRFGAESLTWLIAVPNVQIDSGRVAATMHVFGSLIFIFAAVVASPSLIRNTLLRVGILALFITAAFVSGRAALLVAVAVGIAINVIISASGKPSKLIASVLVAILAGVSIYLGSQVLSDSLFNSGSIDFSLIVKDNIEKIMLGGGDERIAQFRALVQGINDSYAMGAGHGIGVSVSRSELSPWKYELLWLSTLFHVGVIGFAIYLVPLVLLVWAYAHLSLRGQRNEVDTFFFAGFVSICAASLSNPYLESFDFQWMVVLPCVYFCERMRERSPAADVSSSWMRPRVTVNE